MIAISATLMMLASLFAAVPVRAVPGQPPVITSAVGNSMVTAGTSVYVKYAATGVDVGATAAISGTGVTATVAKTGPSNVRLLVTADSTAAAGPRDVTLINPDGLSGTLAGGLTVVAAPPPMLATVVGHVFADANGNGVEDTGDFALSGVAVSVAGSDGTVVSAATDTSGNYSATGLPPGSATATYTTPASYVLTTGNATQALTLVAGATTTAAAVGYQPLGNPPDITGVAESNKEIDPGETRYVRVNATNVQAGATATFSGTGVTAIIASLGATKIRLSVTADLTAEAGWRTLTITNPDGLADTWPDAILVTGDTPPPVVGTVTGHVFGDVDGNGLEDAGEVGLSGVTATLVDAAGTSRSAITGATGDFSVTGVPGSATLTVDAPGGFVLTTGNASQVVTVVADTTTAAAKVGFQPGTASFANVSAAAGVNVAHVSAGCGPPTGVGAAWADVDNDGDQDLYVTNQVGANRLYRNNGDTTGDGVPDFTDIAATVGVNLATASSTATVFADIDNDGDQDLFVSIESSHVLFENQLVETGSLSFTNISAASGITDAGRVHTATFGDIDGDGLLDLYLAKHMPCSGDNTDRLYHNQGNGVFSDWTTYLCGGGAVPCSAVSGLGFAAAIFDYNGDGWQDIYLVNDNITNSWQPNKMFKGGGPNGSGGWVFTEVGATTGTGLSVNGMGVGIGDYDNDGWVDITFSDAGPAHLLRNLGTGSYGDVSVSSGVTAGTTGAVGWGSAFIDYNNDGWQDLMYANGTIATSADLPNSLLVNNKNGTFTDVSAAEGFNDPQRGRGLALADMDGDGYVDVYVANFGGTGLLMQNRSPDNGNPNRHLVISLQGTVSNRDGIGAEITLSTSAGTQKQVVTSGSNHGGGSQKAAFFGLGSHASGIVTIKWPSGIVQNLGQVTGNQILTIVEPGA